MFVGLVVLVQEIYVLPWLHLVDPEQNIFFLTVHYFNFVHIVQQAGQAVILSQWVGGGEGGTSTVFTSSNYFPLPSRVWRKEGGVSTVWQNFLSFLYFISPKKRTYILNF